jgi:beta-glucosidase
LLKNTNSTLPLNKTTIKSIAVIGAIADSVPRDWYGGNPPYKVTARAGIIAKVGTGVTINYAADNTNSAAVNAAKSSEAAIVFVGNHPTCGAGWSQCPNASEGKESVDRKTIALESPQETMVQQVLAANPKTIVVLISSFPYAIKSINNTVPAIVHMTHCSQETGSALADVLFGDYNPAGRLCQTWPDSISQLPTMLDYNIRNGRTYMYFKGAPLYPFGYGLSYSTFTYANLATSADNLCQAPITVSVDVTNSSARPGEEVVQMYLKYPGAAVARPPKQLKGFKRVAIAAGATATVTMPLPYRDVAYWDSTSSSWMVENGSVQILVGGSSADADLKLSKTITTCSGKAGNTEVKSIKFPGGAVSLLNCPMAIVRHGASMGIALSLESIVDCDISVFDLRGFRAGRVTGASTSGGYNFLPLGRTQLRAGLYMVSGRINGNEYSKMCMVK